MRTNGDKAHYWYMGDISAKLSVVDIARCLATEGRFDVQLESENLQAVVDAGWTARRAGRLLGRPVRVSTTRTEAPGGALVMTAVLLDL
jgi:hypothetical protein